MEACSRYRDQCEKLKAEANLVCLMNKDGDHSVGSSKQSTALVVYEAMEEVGRSKVETLGFIQGHWEMIEHFKQ